MLPGGAFAYLINNPNVPPNMRDVLIKQFGLDKPIIEQYFIFIKEFFTTGNLGISFSRLQPVSQVILEALPWTLTLVTTSVVISAIIGILLGLLVAYKRASKMDVFFVSVAMFLRSMPGFWLGMVLLIVIGFYMHLAPLFGAYTYGVTYATPFEYIADVLYHLWLPLVSLILLTTPTYLVITRNAVLDVMSEDYIMAAYARGLPERNILLKHAFKPSCAAILTLLAMDLGVSLGGAMLIERVFSIPGIGRLTYDAIYMQDYPLLLGVVVYTSAVTLTLVTLVEILQSVLDPRVRLE